MTPSPFAEQHRANAAVFGDLVRGATADSWNSPAPVDGWTARDVVGHLIEWLPGLLASGSDVVLPAGPSVADDPVAAWEHHAAAVQAVLDDPAIGDLVLSNPHFGSMSVAQAIDNFYSPDVFMHTWDLAKATGQPVPLDEETCAAMYAGMEPMDEMLRQSGQYGPRVDVPADASAVDRLMGFIGRDPAAWA